MKFICFFFIFRLLNIIDAKKRTKKKSARHFSISYYLLNIIKKNVLSPVFAAH